MTKKALWQNIKELIDCDNSIASLEHDIATCKQVVANNKNQTNQLHTNLSNKKQSIFDAKKHIDLQELEIKDYKSKEAEKESKLSDITDAKAYKALEKELEMVNFKRVALEEDTEKKKLLLLETETTFAQESTTLEEKIQTLAHESELKEENIADLTQKLDACLEQRSSITPTVPADWLAKYERMKQNVKDPIVAVQNDHCSACFYNILYQDLIKLKKSHVLLCRNCYRFLYYNQEETQAAAQGSY